MAKLCITIVVVLYCSRLTYSQNQLLGYMPYIDLASRTEAQLRYEPFKKFTLQSGVEIRNSRSAHYFDQVSIECKAQYKTFYNIRAAIGVNYILAHNQIEDHTRAESHIRIEYGLAKKIVVDRFSIVAKARYYDYFNMSHKTKYNRRTQSVIKYNQK